ncbi:MAG: hypothetical protein GY754_16590 [bacterium]|nr:hypothetical protein [bacterium]
MKKFAKNRKNLKPMGIGDLISADLGSFDLGDSFGSLTAKGKKLFLNKFTPENLDEIVQTVGLKDHLKKKGFDKLHITTDVDDTLIHYLKIYAGSEDPNNLLVDLRVSESKFVPDNKFFEDERGVVTYDMIVIEWLSAHNPKSNFSSDKPQLPGQRSPGLGVLKYCFEMMHVVAKEVTKDGFLDIPDHLHGAIMYSKKFKFFDPAHEGVLQALVRDLKGYSLSDISWGVLTGTIIEKFKNAPQKYDPSEQIFYVSNRMKKYYNSSKYKSIFNKYYKRKKFNFDYDLMVEKRDKMLKEKNIVDI